VSQNSAIFQIRDIRQGAHFFMLPNSASDVLYISFPKILQREFHEWIENSLEVDLYLDAVMKKYTFIDAKINSCVCGQNIDVQNSRELGVIFRTMLVGIRRKNA